VFDVDEGRRPAFALCFCDCMQRQSGLTARFGAVNFNDSSARKSADAERQIECDRTGLNDLERHAFLEISHAHNRAFAELTLDLRERTA